MPPKTRALVIDDEKQALDELKVLLTSEDYLVDIAQSPLKGLEMYRDRFYDFVLLDLQMQEKNGLEVLEEIKRMDRYAVVVIVTTYDKAERAAETIRKGASDYVVKPLLPSKLREVLGRLSNEISIRRAYMQQLAEISANRLDKIYAKSSVMHRIFEKIQTIARADSTVLITGESGTGKELVARAIHKLSTRSNHPFIPINCSAFQETLLESELFGYEQGAFTDARSAKKGLFLSANGGTFFFDEIGDMSLSLQAKLLRVLEDRKVRPLGSNTEFKVDIRVLSATNKNLSEEIEKGRFRNDLFFRLNVVELNIPPLRERKDDILFLADHFLDEFNSRFNKKILGFKPEAEKAMLQYDWPGNVRELKNLVERTVLLGSENGYIHLSNFPPELQSLSKDNRVINELNYNKAKDKVLWDFHNDYFSYLLRKNRGNVSRSAFEAGIDRSSLQRLLKKYGIKSSNYRKQRQ